jgi:hypothetical protein
MMDLLHSLGNYVLFTANGDALAVAFACIKVSEVYLFYRSGLALPHAATGKVENECQYTKLLQLQSLQPIINFSVG